MIWKSMGLTVLGLMFGMACGRAAPGLKWSIHDKSRPLPELIEPGTPPTQTAKGTPPADAVVIFDGTSLDNFVGKDGGPAKWKLLDGEMIANKTGDIRTTMPIGDCQMHVEWRSNGGNGNSGIYFMGLYELQVFDSYNNQSPIYADGQAAAIYGQHPPLVNACRDTGKWQTYDVIFRRPRFDDNGKTITPAQMTVFHNGVLVHDHVALTGPTGHHKRPPYKPHADQLPLLIQDHQDPVGYRNIWYRPLGRVP